MMNENGKAYITIVIITFVLIIAGAIYLGNREHEPKRDAMGSISSETLSVMVKEERLKLSNERKARLEKVANKKEEWE